MSNNNSNRKTISRRLSTRQIIALTPQDEKMLKLTYQYMAGYVKRTYLEDLLESKRGLLEELNSFVSVNKSLKEDGNGNGSSVGGSNSSSAAARGSIDFRSETEIKIDEYYKTKDDIAVLEKKVKDHQSMEHTISGKDIEAIMKKLGVSWSKKQIEVSISISISIIISIISISSVI